MQADRESYCSRISSEPMHSDCLMVPSITYPSSWAAAVDKPPPLWSLDSHRSACLGVALSHLDFEFSAALAQQEWYHTLKV